MVFAELVWAGTTPSNGNGQNLQTITLQVNGADVADLTGTAVAGTGDSGANLLSVYRDDITKYVQSGGAISVSDLKASLQSGSGTPLGGWTLSVIWLDPAAALTTVEYRNINERTVPPTVATGSTDTVVLTTTGAPVNSLWLTVWAADPWATKSLAYGGTVLTSDINGTDSEGLQSGYDLLTFTGLPAGGSGLVMTNTASGNRQDGLWIGPMLVIRPATA